MIDGWIEREEGRTHSFFFVMIWEVACHFVEIKLRQTQLRATWESALRPGGPEQGLGNRTGLLVIITVSTFKICLRREGGCCAGFEGF